MPRNYRSVPDLIKQGYMIAQMDDQSAGEPWALPQGLRAQFDDAFARLRTAQQDVETARATKKNAVAQAEEAQRRTRSALTDLKQFIRVVADE